MKNTKKVKKIRLNIARTLVFLLFVYLIVNLVIYVYNEPVRHYEISGNSIVSDADILRSTSLDEYPSFVSVNTKKIENILKKNPFISDAKVSYQIGLNFQINIKITENKPMFVLKSTNQVCLSDGTLIDNTDNKYVGLPLLLNDTLTDARISLAKNLSKLSDGVIYMISEIEYAPTYSTTDSDKAIDDERFLLYMNDKNLVYISASKAKLLDKYLDIMASLNVNTNGTLYLDSLSEGNYVFDYGDKNEK